MQVTQDATLVESFQTGPDGTRICEQNSLKGIAGRGLTYSALGGLTQVNLPDGRMPVALEQGGMRYYLVYDQVGSLRTVADGAGNLAKKIT